LLAAFVREGGGGLHLRDVKIPEIGDGEVLVRLRASGICGTDIEKVRGRNITAPVLGHEVSGVIEKSFSPSYEKGQRIIAHHHVACYSCEMCFRGKFTMCNSFKTSNFDPCGFAEYFRVPYENVRGGGVILLPDELSCEEGALVEPLACCYRALKNADVRPGMTTIIVGAGSIGLMHLSLLPAFGVVDIFVTDIVKEKIDFALRLGATKGFDANLDTGRELTKLGISEGADFVIVASGSSAAIRNSLNLVKTGGTLLLFGAPERGTSIEIPFDQMFLSERRIIPSYSASESDMRKVVELLVSGSATVKQIISARVPLPKTEEAFKLAQSIMGKVIVTN
jgi:L-iditol 2-dehydrogenase